MCATRNTSVLATTAPILPVFLGVFSYTLLFDLMAFDKKKRYSLCFTGEREVPEDEVSFPKLKNW